MTPLWAALLPHPPNTSPRRTDARIDAKATRADAGAGVAAAAVIAADTNPAPATMHGLALWALQFTPRVACVPSDSAFGDALVLELSASQRLFGGRQQLARRLLREAQQLEVHAISWAPTSLAAIALARCQQRHGFGAPLAKILAPLPLAAGRPT